MRVFIVVGAALLLSGCSAPPAWMLPANTTVSGPSGDLSSPPDFWISQGKLAAKDAGGPTYDGPAYDAYWKCLGQRMVDISPPDVNAAVSKYVKTDLYSDFSEAVDKAQSFLNTYKHTNGTDAAADARMYCFAKTGT